MFTAFSVCNPLANHLAMQGNVRVRPPPSSLHCSVLMFVDSRHILSNVGRVAARDSSRTYATVNDLFVALCEDDSIYGLFRMMKGR